MGRYWLFKSDPETFGITELERSPGRTAMWDGVRNYKARNHLRDDVRIGDRVLFYHSQCKPPAIVGTAEVVRRAYPDPTQFDPASDGHDPGSSPENPRWYAVDIRLESKLDRPVTLTELRRTRGLRKMVLLQNSRLSIQPVTAAQWRLVLELAERR